MVVFKRRIIHFVCRIQKTSRFSTRIRCGCVREQGLGGEARGQDVRVHLRILLPGSYLFDLEHPTPEMRGQHLVLERFHRREAVAVDLVEEPEIPGQRAGVVFHALTTEVFEQIVVRMDAVERGVGGMRFVEVPEQVVNEMRKGFGNGHGSLRASGHRLPAGDAGRGDPSMVQ